MLRIELIAVGRLKNGPLLEQFQEYQKRITWRFDLTEIEARTTSEEHSKIETRLGTGAYTIMLDERGRNLTSREFAAVFDSGSEAAMRGVQIIIGGADGLSDNIRNRADLLLSFGKLTWPHMLTRVMLAEQIYRAQQILLGHPYHRD